jgi:hypothetical protein
MAKQPIEFTYRFICGDTERVEKTCVVRLDPDSLEAEPATDPSPPPWTKLTVERCGVCPLNPGEIEYCPAALSFVEILREFGELLSYDRVEATVVTKERTVTVNTSCQKALSSLVGLRMATSGCPVLAKFKPMARFHLPFSSTEETVFRSVGAYLLAQYFRKRRGRDADLDLAGLRETYGLIHEVNVGLANRLRTIPAGEAHLNALVILDLFTHALPISIDENLAEIEHMFGPFLDSE